jgi:hypothetical protein
MWATAPVGRSARLRPDALSNLARTSRDTHCDTAAKQQRGTRAYDGEQRNHRNCDERRTGANRKREDRFVDGVDVPKLVLRELASLPVPDNSSCDGNSNAEQ